MTSPQPTPSKSSPELPESVRQAIKQAVADILPNDNADSCHEAFVHVVKALTPLWPSADGRGEAVTGETSDGYHTFNELYDHRCTLFLALMKAHPSISWISTKHADNSTFGDWFIAGMRLPTGDVTYHLPARMWSLACATGAEVRERGYEWDGHTSADVVKRIQEWLSSPSPLAGLPTPESEMKCEGCAATATKRDSEGIPLCEDCYAELKASSVLALDAPETDAVWKACKPKTWQVSFEKMHKHAESLERRLAAAREEVEALTKTCEERFDCISSLRAQLATAKAASQGDRDFRLAVEEALAKEAGDTQINAVEVLVSVLNERDRLASELAKANAAVEAERLELGRVHGDIGLFAKKHLGISDNLPTAETFERMAREIHRIRETSSARLDSCIESDDLLHRMWKAYGNPDSEISREVKNYMDMNEWPHDERIAWHRRKLAQLAAQQSVPPEARAVEAAIARMNRACDLMGTIRTETGPVAGHEDPGAIEDCWREAFDELVQAEDSLRTCFPPSEGEEWASDGTPTDAQRARDTAHFNGWLDSRVNKNALPDRAYVWNAACAYARRLAADPARPTAAREDTRNLPIDESNLLLLGFIKGEFFNGVQYWEWVVTIEDCSHREWARIVVCRGNGSDPDCWDIRFHRQDGNTFRPLDRVTLKYGARKMGELIDLINAIDYKRPAAPDAAMQQGGKTP